jgi:hypothetical protein
MESPIPVKRQRGVRKPRNSEFLSRIFTAREAIARGEGVSLADYKKRIVKKDGKRI